MDLSKNNIAIVDDDEDILFSAKLFLKKYFNKIVCFSHPNELLELILEEKIDVVLLDLNYKKGKNDGEEGLCALESIKSMPKSPEVIVMTAYAEVSTAVNAVKKGAFDFIVKPWQNEKLLISILNATQKKSMAEELIQQRQIINSRLEILDPIIGESVENQKIRDTIAQIAPTSANIIIFGSNGTGKELIAKHICKFTKPSNKPFIRVDLTSIPKKLQTETLFTNSTNQTSKWCAAKNGILLIKNIDLLTAENQKKLLNYWDLNESSPQKIICTSLNEEKIVSLNKTLLYKLNTIEIKIPDLINRLEDIQELIEYYLDFYNTKYGKSIRFIENKIISQYEYPWEGNIRELKRAIERAVLVSKTQFSYEDLLPNNLLADENIQKLDDIEKGYIVQVLKRNRNNIKKSAAQLGISRASLYRRIEKYKL